MTTNYSDRIAQLKDKSHMELVGMVLDEEYNWFMRDCADVSNGEPDEHGNGKRIPYIGWFWRDVQWHDRDVPIGDCGEFIGFMVSNKWDYPCRSLTNEEFDRVVAIIDEARAAYARGGLASDLAAARNAKLDELWNYMQTLSVPRTEDD